MRKKKREPQAEQTPEAPGRPRITPVDVQQKEFRLAFRGYNERDVDAFLDEITEEISLLVEENRRLREQAGTAPPAPPFQGAGDPSGDAEETLARAREEAARIVREAQANAAVMGSAGGPGAAAAISPFVKMEREFLQSLAGVIQDHAESVKEMVRAARDSSVEAEPVPAEAEPTAQAEPTPEPTPEPEPESVTWTSVAEAAKAEPPRTPILQPDRVTIVDEPAEPEPEVVSEPGPEAVTAKVEKPESASVTVEPSAGDEGERSLRDLFWGED